MVNKKSGITQVRKKQVDNDDFKTRQLFFVGERVLVQPSISMRCPEVVAAKPGTVIDVGFYTGQVTNPYPEYSRRRRTSFARYVGKDVIFEGNDWSSDLYDLGYLIVYRVLDDVKYTNEIALGDRYTIVRQHPEELGTQFEDLLDNEYGLVRSLALQGDLRMEAAALTTLRNIREQIYADAFKAESDLVNKLARGETQRAAILATMRNLRQYLEKQVEK